jgi:hypothetical protein
MKRRKEIVYLFMVMELNHFHGLTTFLLSVLRKGITDYTYMMFVVEDLAP